MNDLTSEIIHQVENAYLAKRTLCIEGGNSKNFIGRNIHGNTLSIKNHTGVIEHEPTELYITARSGTLLKDIEQEIAQCNQIIPFEPPHFGSTATIGGMVATGLSGPRRASCGAVRDSVLGLEIINGKGELLKFGGKVMKNVAGYDISRLMCGSFGTLGVLTSISFRLIPKPECEKSIAIASTSQDAIKRMNELASTPIPITATFFDGEDLYIRLSGSQSAVQKCIQNIGGDILGNDNAFWNSVKEQSHRFFSTGLPLWRISVPPNTPELNLVGQYAMEWNGALRWYASNENPDTLRKEANKAGGHACLFRGASSNDIFHPLGKTTYLINKKLKKVFDPENILNPGKMYEGI